MRTKKREAEGDRATAKLLVNQPGTGGWRVIGYAVSCDWRFQPLNTLPKEEKFEQTQLVFVTQQSQKRGHGQAFKTIW